MFLNHWRTKLFIALYIVIQANIWTACGDDDAKDKIPDVSNIDLAVKIQRFDQDLFAIDTNNIKGGITTLEQKYPQFFPIFLQVLNGRGAMQPAEQLIGGFIKDTRVRKLNDTCQVAYKDMSDLDKEFTQAFKFYKYYFPKQTTPEVCSMISEYTYAAFPYGDNGLAVGIDDFLGANHTGYNGIENFTRYIRRSMDKTHLLKRAMEAHVDGIVDEYAPRSNRLLDVMIHNGKKLYLLDKLMPLSPDSVKLDYTQKQVDWCKQNEAETWAYLLSEDLLYSIKGETWAKLVNPSPSGTTKMPTDSPGRVGNWVGMQIIRAYMKRNPNTSVEELMKIQDAQSILDKSKYKPKRK